MRRLALLMGVLGLSGCATTTDPGLLAQAVRPIYCTAGTDCEEKWSRAVSWIVRNGRWKIQTQTEQMIQTFNGDQYSTDPAFTVVKTAIGGGKYQIDIQAGCNNMFGCTPNPATAVASFKRFVDPA